MSFKFVDPSKVPPPPSGSTSGRTKYYRSFLEQLPEDKVGVLPVTAEQDARGMKVSVGRIATTMGIKIRSWDNATGDGDEKKPATEVYVQRKP